MSTARQSTRPCRTNHASKLARFAGIVVGAASLTALAATMAPVAAHAAPASVAVSPAPSISGTPGLATLNVPYSFAFTIGGSPAPTASVVGSLPLPPGLSLTPTGVLSGTPMVAGTYHLDLRAANGQGPDANFSSVVTVAPLGPAATIAVASGDQQQARAGLAFGKPLAVLVTDRYGRPVPNTPVTFLPNGPLAFTTGISKAVSDASGVATSATLMATGVTAPTVGSVWAQLPNGIVMTRFSETVVPTAADLQVTLTTPAHWPTTGRSTFKATITVTNNGPDVAAGVTTAIIVPQDVMVWNAGGAQGQTVLTWTAADLLPVGRTLTYTVVFSTTDSLMATPQSRTFQANTTSSLSDLAPQNNTASTTITPA